MPGYEDTHWAATDKQIEAFRKQVQSAFDHERDRLIHLEIACQLMRLTAQVEDLAQATHRLADSPR
jgi:hypothetical protein